MLYTDLAPFSSSLFPPSTARPNTDTPPSRHSSTGVYTLPVTSDLCAICSACKHQRRHRIAAQGPAVGDADLPHVVVLTQ